jgi:hypothetical protein
MVFTAAGPLLAAAIQLGPADTLPPPRRAHHSLAYDGSARRVILSGGSTPLDGGQRFEMFNDLWAFDGTGWRRLGLTGDRLSGSTLAFDRDQNRLVGFGGYDGRSRPDLRVLENDAWRTVGRHPESGMAEPGFVYDVRRNRFVAFGGSAGPGRTMGDTWILSAERWERFRDGGPPARQAHGMVYDERRDRVVVFGGMGSGPAGQRPPTLGDTWEFDGRAWTERRVPGPSARSGVGMTWDSARGVTLLFGGVTNDGFQGDTWSWDGSEWRKLADTGPEPRGMGYLAYDRRRDRTVLFGGRKGWPDGDLNDTWEWNGTAWRRVDH